MTDKSEMPILTEPQRKQADGLMERPNFVTDKHLKYLDTLRKSGRTNMLGASLYVQARFNLDDKKSREILTYWMNTLSERHLE
jgi:hypothetical protein